MFGRRTSYSYHGAESQAVISNGSITSIFRLHKSCQLILSNNIYRHRMKFMQQATHFMVACGHFICHSEKLTKSRHWKSQKQCGTCLLCLILSFLSLPAGDPIFEAKKKQPAHYVFAFCVRRQLDRGAEITH